MSLTKTKGVERKRAGDRTCGGCRFLLDDPTDLESALPGILILSSGQGESRGDQGICRIHLQMVTPTMVCTRFQTRNQE